jgi:hypothetical protein
MNVVINAHGHALRKKIGDLGSDVLHWYTPLNSCETSDPQTLNIDLKSYTYTETASDGPRNFPHDHYLGFSAIGEQASLLDGNSAFGAYYADGNTYTKIVLPEYGNLSNIIKLIKYDAYYTRKYTGPIYFYISSCRQFPTGGNGIKTKRRKNIKKRKKSLKHRKTK